MKPGQGQAKLNTDGAFKPGEEAGLGMVLRDHEGEVIFLACRAVAFCTDATEVELMAIEEGLKLALQWTALPFVVETDCA
jgi:ribonuclease HI